LSCQEIGTQILTETPQDQLNFAAMTGARKPNESKLRSEEIAFAVKVAIEMNDRGSSVFGSFIELGT